MGPGARKTFRPSQNDDICREVRGDSPPENFEFRVSEMAFPAF